jgi:hypothetical protein
MSIESVLSRIAELQAGLQPRAVATPTPPATTTPNVFAGTLNQAQAAVASVVPAVATPAAGGTSAGQAIVNLVRGEVGVAEQPPGSNDSARIAQYRQATVGSGVGPWCAYFTSWAAREAGVPLGDSGQGYGLVDDVWAWAERSGKAIPAAGATPAPGDLIVWDEHIGVVESVDADGTIHTIEGNSSDQVAQRTYDAGGGGAIGYVRLG